MYNFSDHAEFFNQSIRFDPTSIKAKDIIKRFFEDYTLAEVRAILWDWFEMAITSENDQYSEASKRGDLLYQYRRIELLIEASYILNQGE